MANFNSSFWYHLYVNLNETIALTGTNLYTHNGTRGDVRFGTWNRENSAQLWQFYNVSDTTFILRCKSCGEDAYLSTKFEPKEESLGHTQALMMRADVSNDSVFWSVAPWNDGTFYFTNKSNGTVWHLNKKLDNWVAMSSNQKMPQNGQRFSFTAIEEIKDGEYSTINLPFPTPTPTPTNPPDAPSNTPPPSTVPTTSSDLTIGAKVGIGVSLGILFLIAFTGFGLFLRLRYQRRKHPKFPQAYESLQKHSSSEVGYRSRQELGDATRHEAGGESLKYGSAVSGVTHEMGVEEVQHEMPGSLAPQSPVELPNSTDRLDAI